MLSHHLKELKTVLSFIYFIHFVTPVTILYFSIEHPLHSQLVHTVNRQSNNSVVMLSHYFKGLKTVLSFIYFIHFVTPVTIPYFPYRARFTSQLAYTVNRQSNNSVVMLSHYFKELNTAVQCLGGHKK